MITTFLFDFSYVLIFPREAGQGVGKQYHHAKLNNNPWQEYLVFNEELIEFVEQQKKVNSYILSNSSPQMLEDMKQYLIPPFVDIFSAQKLALRKSDPHSFIKLAEMLDVPAEHILFTDDQLTNIEAAHQAGCQTIHFESTKEYIRKASLLI